MSKKEAFILGIILILGLGIAGGYYLYNQSKDRILVQIYHAGEVVKEFDAAKDGTYHIQGSYGELDVVCENGQWCITNQECPNHTCAQMGWANPAFAFPIVCLPNDVYVMLQSGD